MRTEPMPDYDSLAAANTQLEDSNEYLQERLEFLGTLLLKIAATNIMVDDEQKKYRRINELCAHGLDLGTHV